MKYKKSIIVIMLAIFIFSIAAASASDVNDTQIASDDTGPMELSAGDEITEDNLQTSEENTTLAVVDNDETLSAQTNSEILTAGPYNYTYLREQIRTGGNINLIKGTYTYNQNDGDTIKITDSCVINGNGAVIDMAGSDHSAFLITASDVTIKNLTIKNANFEGSGGAIHFAKSGTVENCNFVDNKATSYGGGAIYFTSSGTVENCNFTNNSALHGGAINMGSGTVENCNFTNNQANGSNSRGGAIYMYSGSVENCNFTGNNAITGSAIYFYSTSATKTVSNSRFLNNRANAEDLQVTKNDNNITIVFTGKDNLLNAIYSRNDAEVTFTNVTYWSANGIATTESSAIKPPRSNKEAGQNITVGVVINDVIVLSEVYLTDENGMIVLDISAGENYFIYVRHDTDSYYTEVENITSKNTKFSVNVTSQTTNNKTVNITAKSNIPNEVIDGKLLFILPNSNPINATYAGNGTWWAVYTFDGAGDYNVNASYVGLDNVSITSATISIIYDASISVDSNSLELKVGESGEVKYMTDPKGLNIMGESSNSSVAKVMFSNGAVKIIAAGEGNATVTFTINQGDYFANTTELSVTVRKVNLTIQATAEPIILGENATVVITGLENATGTVSVRAGDGIYNDTVSMGTATVVIPGLIENTTAEISYLGDSKHNKAYTEIVIVVNPKPKENATISIDAPQISVGEEATVTVTLPFDAIGNVTIGNTSCEVIESVATAILYNLTAGNITVPVIYSGDGKYNPIETNVTIIVKKLDPKITIGDIKGDVGKTVNMNVTVDGGDATGNITYGGVNYTVDKGKATVPIAITKAGAQTITVTYTGDERYSGESADKEFTAGKGASSIKIEGSEKITVGENATVTVTVSPGAATGTVNITVDGASYGKPIAVKNSTASVIVTDLANGTHTITAQYGGDANYNASGIANISVTVDKVNSTGNIKIEIGNTTYGENLIVNVTLPGDATGNIQAKVDGRAVDTVEVIDGKATVAVPSLTAGNHTVEISYSGDDKYLQANVTRKVTVIKRDVSENVTIPSDVTYGDNATVNVVLPVDATGNVTVKVDGEEVETVVVIDGTANCSLPALSAGEHAVEIAYSGDGNYNPDIETKNITVLKQNATVELSVPENVTYGDNATVNVVLPIDATGNVTVKVDGEEVETVEVIDGTANISLPALSAGDHNVEIAYSGDDKYAPLSQTSNVTVKKSTPNLTAKAKTFKGTDKIKKYTVTLKDSNGNPIVNATVILKVNGETYTAKTDGKGKATFNLTKLTKKGTYTALIKYAGDENFKKASIKAKITVKSTWKTISKGSNYHTMVKKIQRSLKNHGFYIKYNKRFLKVDGIFHIYTEKAVKQFQKANGLKQTGKVDEITAEKLGLI